MIVTRRWLEEWVNLDGITTDEICQKLNSIGLEVDSLKRVEIPSEIVVGRVVSCEKHPNADRLSVCRVDIGSCIKQIVCGAKNIKENLFVPVATVGSVLPGGLEIKPTKLRGIESEGMICSSEELGLPKIEDGILELDESIGELAEGKKIAEFPLLCDDIIEIELTANRGDCLSIHGVARELSVGFNRPLKTLEFDENFSQRIGIGRILQFTHAGNPPGSLVYHVFDLHSISVPLLIKLRLAFIEQLPEMPIDSYFNYAVHTSGVILRHYGFSKLSKGKEKAKLILKELKDGLGAVEYDGETASVVGINQNEKLKSDLTEKTVILEASYISPAIVAPAVKKMKLKTDSFYYRTSRGSEPDLKFGIRVLFFLLKKYADVGIYAGESEYITPKEPVTIDISVEEMESLIGQKVELSEAVTILSRLGFEIHKTEEGRIIADVPLFRHDILNRQDVIEEIVRIIGIQNIAPKPLEFTEANRMSQSLKRHRFIRDIRIKAVSNGFFETVHYIFCDSKRVKDFGFEPIPSAKALKNPITAEMDTLRPNLMINMLDSLQKNVNMSKKRIPLFEIGTVFDTQRNEYQQMVLVFCGEKDPDSVVNSGKPEPMDFASFAYMVSAVIGAFDMQKPKSINCMMHPYLAADIAKNGTVVGQIAKLHPNVAMSFGLPETFFAQIDISLLKPETVCADKISSLTPIYRDLSIVVSQSVSYSDIRMALKESLPEIVEKFYPIDRYVDDSLGEKMSLTLRFVIVPYERVLEESEINSVMEEILKTLQTRFDARLR